MKERRLTIYMMPVPCPGGGTRLMAFGFGSDGTMWIDPADMGIGPQHAPQLALISGGKFLATNPVTGQVLVNAKVALEVIPDPARRESWRKHIASMIREHQMIQQRGTE
jgi:hypothetical protein